MFTEAPSCTFKLIYQHLDFLSSVSNDGTVIRKEHFRYKYAVSFGLDSEVKYIEQIFVVSVYKLPP